MLTITTVFDEAIFSPPNSQHIKWAYNHIYQCHDTSWKNINWRNGYDMMNTQLCSFYDPEREVNDNGVSQ